MQACKYSNGEKVSLEFVGEIEFHTPIKNGNITRIPISFHGGKWLDNSSIVFKKVSLHRYEFEIRMTVVTQLASGSGNRRPKEIVLKNLLPGTYQVIYQNPDETGVRIKEIKI